MTAIYVHIIRYWSTVPPTGTAKENHGFRYTRMYGKARMEMKAGLTFACMNLKKLAKMKVKMRLIEAGHALNQLIYVYFSFRIRKALPA